MVGANQWGVWVTGVRPVTGRDGEVAFAVMADIPVEPLRLSGVRGDAAQPLAALLHAAAVRLTKAEIDAVTDGLTGLYNHRHLQDRLTEEAERAVKCGDRLAVLFCDLDDFKRFNDTYGHRMGDGVLEGTARAIENCVRRGDVVARYGGEEFVVLIAGADERTATAAAERIRAAVARANSGPDGARITISVGIALCPEHGRTREELMAAADAAMYEAKAAGRDRIVIYEPAWKSDGDATAHATQQAIPAKAPVANAGGDRRLRSIERRVADRRARERRAPRLDRRSSGGDRRGGTGEEPPAREGDGGTTG